jgi:hypothetical protein
LRVKKLALYIKCNEILSREKGERAVPERKGQRAAG